MTTQFTEESQVPAPRLLWATLVGLAVFWSLFGFGVWTLMRMAGHA